MSAQPAGTRAAATEAADAAAPLDLLLAAAALGPARRLLPGGAGVWFATGLARRPHRLARRATFLAGELARVGLGRSSLAPPPGDRRFTDPAWTSNPLLRRLVQAYLGAGQAAEQLLADADLEWRDAERMRFLVDNLVQALAPSNNPDATQRICRADRSLVLGLCSGGILAAMALAHLTAIGQRDRVAGFGLAVTVLDQARAGTAGAILDEGTARAAVAASAARGFLDGRALAEVFAWLRPGDLIWSYWVNNYLAGRTPPPFDILHWNADTTRMTAGLHRDLVRLAVDNALTRPGGASLLGSPVDLAKLDLDAYVVAGVADHLCPWQSCYRSTQLLGGRSRFVLSTSGHIASMVNPPGNPKASFRTAPDNPPDPADWLGQASTERGSWWPDFVGWLERRGGGEKARPRRLGAAGFRPMDPAPGTYVMDR